MENPENQLENNDNQTENKVDLESAQRQENISGTQIDENNEADLSVENNNAIDDESKLLEILKGKGFEVESFDDLEKLREPKIKEVNPLSDLMDDDDKRYFAFKKETGGSRKEFDALNTDPDLISPLDYAIDKIKADSGLSNISRKEAVEILEEELDITDLSNIDDLGGRDKMKLSKFIKDVKEKRIEEYNKIRKIDFNSESKSEKPNEETVVLENGQKMPKKKYDEIVKKREQYLNSNKESVNSVTDSEFKVIFDDNGSKKELSFSYEYNEKDKQSMLSMTEDTGKLLERYYSENKFDHKQFNEDVFWLDKENRNKAIASLIHKAIAQNTEEVLKGRGNVNLTQPSLPEHNDKNVKMVSLGDIFSKR